MTKKTYVLDTSVLLHDHTALYQFKDHYVVLPLAVIQELDNNKTRQGDVGFAAREVLRQLDSGEHTHVTVNLLVSPLSMSADEQIITAAEKPCVLVTQDVAMRVLARQAGVDVEPYRHTQPKRGMRSGVTLVDDRDDLITALHTDGVVDYEAELPYNEFVRLKSGSRSAVAMYREGQLTKLPLSARPYGLEPRNLEQKLAVAAMMDDSIKLVSIAGAGGTGKTLCSLACALEQRRDFKQVLLTRPIVSLSGKDLGFIPGGLDEKMAPFLGPFYDNLGVLKELRDGNKADIERMLEEDKIHIEPISYIRGRSFNRVMLICDEAQNLTPHEIKTLTTRMGEGSKLIVQGDVSQVDHPHLDNRTNGLAYLVDRMSRCPLYAHVTLTKTERSALAEAGAERL